MSDSAATLDDLLAHATWARRLAYRLVRDEAAADDLVQEAWEVALRTRPEAGRPVRPWLGTVLRNLFRMKWRAQTRRETREVATEAERAHVTEPPRHGDELLVQLEQQKLLGDLVLALDEPFRTTVLLRFYAGLSGADIAAQQQVPAGTVRWRLKEGLTRLRAALDARHEGDREKWRLALTPLGDLDLGLPKPPPAAAPLAQGALSMKILFATVLAGAGAAATVVAARPALVTKTPSAPIATPAPPPAPVAATHKVARLDKQARATLLADLRKVRTAKPPALDREYISAQMKEILPLIKECFESAIERTPNLSGRVVTHFKIVADENLGGLVVDSTIEEKGTNIVDAPLRECIQESMYALRFPAPEGGGETDVTFPFVLNSADPVEGEE